MFQERLLPTQQRLVTEVAESLRPEALVPLVVIAGPAGFEVERAHDEIYRHWQRAQQEGKGARGATYTVFLDQTAAKLHLVDLIPTQATLRDNPGSTIFLKNVQYLRPDGLQPFETVVRQFSASKTTCVASLALPVLPQAREALTTAFNRLNDHGLIHYITVRPVPRSSFDSELTAALGAKPEPALSERTWALTHGWPAAITESMRISHDFDMLRTVDRHAFLTPGHGYPQLTETDNVVRWIRCEGTQLWNAAKAVSVLSPLGSDLPWLLAEAVQVTTQDAVELLARLEHAGLLRYHRAESEWRFRVPLTGAGLRSALGPYERRKLAKIAVDALWAGTAYSDDPGYLPDQLALAGRMVDPERARQDLLAHADRSALTGGDQAIGWLRAAGEVTSDRIDRAEILLAHARACLTHGLAELAIDSSSTLLSDFADEITKTNLMDVCFVHIGALFEAKNLSTLRKIAHENWWPWPGDLLQQAICRAFALSLLGRWREAHELLHNLRQESGIADFAKYINYISPPADLWLGLTAEFDAEVAVLPERVEQGQRPADELVRHTSALLALGELGRVDDLLARTRKVRVRLGDPARMAMAFYRGEFDKSLDLARRNIATSSPHGCDANQSVMFQLAAMLQLSRGKLTRARELLATARSRQPTQPHVLALPEAALEMMFGEYERARSLLLTAVNRAENDGIVAQTDCLWIGVAGVAIVGNAGREQIPECLHRLDKIADQIGTESAEIHRLTLRAFVDSDNRAAQTALELLSRRGQPFEQAAGIEQLVRFGVVDPALLTEAHDHYGASDALLRRAWLRTLMQHHGVTVPARQATVVENERLLAVLVAEGLSNKQIAALLQTSDKSVEGRLSRLFLRAGYQSRVELATAMLTGQFEPGR